MGRGVGGHLLNYVVNMIEALMALIAAFGVLTALNPHAAAAASGSCHPRGDVHRAQRQAAAQRRPALARDPSGRARMGTLRGASAGGGLRGCRSRPGGTQRCGSGHPLHAAMQAASAGGSSCPTDMAE